MIELTLPYPPSVNNYKRIGRTVTTKLGKSYQQRVNNVQTTVFYWKVASIIAEKQLKRYFPATIYLEVILCLHPPDKRRRDIDNGVKIILDSLERGGLIENDYQICRLLVERCAIIPLGKVVVRIQELIT